MRHDPTNQPTNRRARRVIHTLLPCMMALAGCAGEVTDAPGSGEARIRALHLVPDAPAVDVQLDGWAAFTDLAFTRGTEYATLISGAHDLEVTVAGSPDGVLLSVPGAELAERGSYTAVAYGSAADPRALLIADETGSAPSDAVRIRAIHTADGVPSVDVLVLPDDGDPQILWDDLEPGAAGDVRDVSSGAHVLGLDLDGDMGADLRFRLPDISAGTYVNLFAVLDADGAPFLLAQLPGGITARIDVDDLTLDDGTAGVRVLHASPDAPAVDVYVDDGAEAAFSDVPFSWGTGYATLAEGPHRFRVSATGSGADAAVLDADGVMLDGGRYYTVVAYDRLADIKPLVVADDYEGVTPGRVRLRAIHAAAGVGAVDVYAIDSTGAATRIADDASFGAAGEYAEAAPGTTTIAFDTGDDGVTDAYFDLPAFVAGTVANVFALTDAEGALFLIAQLRDGNALRVDASTAARPAGAIRVLHLSPDAPAVDVFLNDGTAPAVEGLAFGSGTGYATLPAMSYDIDVSATGTSAADSVISVPGFTVAPEGSYTIVAYDSLSSIAPLALTDDLSPTSSGMIRIRAVHTATAVGEVDVLVIPEHGIANVLYDDLAFGTASDYAEVPAGSYLLGLDLNDDRVAEATFRTPHIPAGAIANVFAVAEPDAVYLLAQLADGSTLRVDASH